MTNHSSKNKLVGLIPLLLFAILAVSVLSVLFSGTKTYASITNRDSITYANRTTAQYFSTKLKQTDGLIGVEAFGNECAVTLAETINGTTYITRLYCYNGYLYELFSPASADVSPQDGEKLLKLNSMTATIDNGLLTINLDGKTIVFAVRN